METKKETYINKFRVSNFQVEYPSEEELNFTKKKTFFDFRLPVEFAPQEITDSGLHRKFIPNAMVAISLIRIICNFKKTFRRNGEIGEPFAQLNATIMRNFLFTVGPDYAKMLRKLTELGWIEVDQKYKIGKKSKGYRIGPKFKNSEWKVYDWNESLKKHLPGFSEGKIAGLKNGILENLWSRAQNFFSTYENMEDGILKSICQTTMSAIGGMSIKLCPELDAIVIQAAKDKNLEYIAQQKALGKPIVYSEEDHLNSYKATLMAIHEKHFHVICHDSRYEDHTDRLFTNWTNCKKEFKPFVSLDGRKLVTIDIKSCQPALLSIFYNESAEDQREKEKYIDIITNGDIYEFLAQGLMNRDKAKMETFRVMFAMNSQQKGPLCDNFKKEFPLLAERVKEKKIGNYKRVAREMQLNESRIMVWGVLNELLLNKKIKCLSAHDSISCFPEDAELVKKTINDCFFAHMGFYPTLKVD